MYLGTIRGTDSLTLHAEANRNKKLQTLSFDNHLIETLSAQKNNRIQEVDTLGNLNELGQDVATLAGQVQPSRNTESAKNTGNVITLEQKKAHGVNHYVPSDTLQLDSDLKSSHERTLRTPVGYFQLIHGSVVARNNTGIDLLATLFCFATVHLMHWGSLDLSSNRTIILLAALVAIVASVAAGEACSKGKRKTLSTELTHLWLSWACAFAAVGSIAYLTPMRLDVSGLWISTSMMATLVSLAGIRFLRRLDFIPGNRVMAKNIVICGHASNIKPVMHSLYGLSNTRVRVLKVFEFESPHSVDEDSSNSLQIAGNQISNFVDSQRQSGIAIEQVWIAASTDQAKIVDVLSDSLINHPLDVCVAPDLYAKQLLNGDVTQYGDTEIVNVSEISLSPSADRWKRVFDFCIASAALLVLSIPMTIIAATVKINSPGPALFRQKRYGVHGHEIEVFKFRSMKVHSDTQVKQATKDDNRVTSIGKVLRCTSLDELPQLLNVLNGTMSLVGPRPHAVAHNEYWRTRIRGYMLRHKVRPGITGWAQVNGWRGETDKAFKMQQRVRHDLEYVKAWSPWLDVKIMLLTVVKGFFNKNAY